MGLTKSYNKIDDAIKSISDTCDQLEKDINSIKDQIIELDSVETKSDRSSFANCLEEIDEVRNKLINLVEVTFNYREQIIYEIKHYDFRNPEPEESEEKQAQK